MGAESAIAPWISIENLSLEFSGGANWMGAESAIAPWISIENLSLEFSVPGGT
jgi:hypothetical protein